MTGKRNILLLALICSVIQVMGQNGGSESRPYKIGEALEFRVKYGWFTIGRASVEIPNDTIIQEDLAYNVDVRAKTAGLLGFFSNTEDRFTESVDINNFKPIVSSQNFQEGRKRDIQNNYYDFDNKIVRVQKTDTDEMTADKIKTYDLEQDALGMMSSYLYLRNINFHGLKMEDSVMVNSFFGKKHYPFGIEYAGIEEIKTNYGRQLTHKLYILFPVTKTFPEARSVVVWTTLDKNQLPLRVEAKLKFGQVTCELENYRNLRYRFDP